MDNDNFKKTKSFKAKLNFLIIFLFVLGIGVFGFKNNAEAATYYMNADGSEDCSSLQECFGIMSGGDELIIRSGVYTGDNNVLDHSHLPPSGIDANYTIIRAENDGAVIFDGENVRAMFSLYGGGAAGNPHHIIFQGIQWRNSSGTLVTVVYADHIKFIRCSCYDGQGDGFSALYTSNILFENCWSWGAARKHFYIGKESFNIIVRQCVVRHDRYASYRDQEAFMAYESHDVEFQNCIAIDGDQGNYYIPAGDTTANAFTTRTAGLPVYNVNYRGCISIGNDDMIGWQGSNPCDFSVVDSLHWDSKLGIRIRASGSDFNHCTFGDVSGVDTWSILAYLEGGDPINNSLLYSAYQGIYAASSNSDYNSLFNITNNYSGSPGAHDLSRENNNEIDPIDGIPGNSIPALKYLLRIENGSNLDDVASDGGDIGATIIYQYGKTGTMWGEPGYNLLQDGTNGQDIVKLWPFPNEDIIKQQMQSYSYTGPDKDGVIGVITGNRGFAENTNDQFGKPLTLTRYIWQYLGNQIPCEIYNECNSSNQYRADVDNNSQINTTDAMLTLRNSLGLSMTNTNWQTSTTTGDVNCDNITNSTDAMLILRYSLGLSMEGTGWCI